MAKKPAAPNALTADAAPLKSDGRAGAPVPDGERPPVPVAIGADAE